MSHPTCYYSVSPGRCDRRDLLVDLEGFHLVAAARRECGLVLDIESCDRCAGCPGCGVITQGHGRVVVEVIDAPLGRGPSVDPVAQTTLDMPRNHLPDGDIPGAQREGVRTPGASGCAGDPLGNPTVTLRRGATILGLARQLGTTWNTVWSHIKPCLQAASEPRPLHRRAGTQSR